MTGDQATLFAILLALFVLLVWGRWRYDVVAFAALMTTVAAGLVPAQTAFDGFAHPATITVAAVLVLSRVLSGTGAIDRLTRLVRPAMEGTTGHVGALSGLAAAMSAMMNNVGALGILMPLAIQTARKASRSPSIVLMPLSFGSMLGGLITLIGTPPNIIVASYRGELTGTSFHMFDFTPVGLALAVAGIAFITLIGWRLVPQRAGTRAKGELFDIENYVTEVTVPEENPNIGKTLREIDELTKDIDAVIMDQIRGDRVYPPATRKQLRAGDVLKIEGRPDEIDKFVSTVQLAAEQGKPSLLRNLHRWLFDDVRFRDGLGPDELDRYRSANDFAARFCHRLAGNATALDAAAVAELRHFYRLPIGDKISHIRAGAFRPSAN